MLSSAGHACELGGDVRELPFPDVSPAKKRRQPLGFSPAEARILRTPFALQARSPGPERPPGRGLDGAASGGVGVYGEFVRKTGVGATAGCVLSSRVGAAVA